MTGEDQSLEMCKEANKEAYKKAYKCLPLWLGRVGFKSLWSDLPVHCKEARCGCNNSSDDKCETVDEYVENYEARFKDESNYILVKSLSESLSYLDSKSSGLLAANGIIITAIIFTLTNNLNIVYGMILKIFGLITLVPLTLSSLFLLSVLRVKWTPSSEIQIPESQGSGDNNEVSLDCFPWNLLATRTRRTIKYRMALMLTNLSTWVLFLCVIFSIVSEIIIFYN